MASFSPRPYLVVKSRQFCLEVGTDSADDVPASSSTVPQSSAESVTQVGPPKSPTKGNSETVSQPVGKNVAKKSGKELGSVEKVATKTADVSQASTSVAQSLPVIHLWPPTSPAKPNSGSACVLELEKLSESDVLQLNSVLDKYSSRSAVAGDSASETRETVDNAYNSGAAAGPSTSTATGNEVNRVESSDESDADAYDADWYRPSSKIAKKGGARKWWSDTEEEMLYKGVQAHGVGNWALIHKNFVRSRSNINIKDKWRTILQQGRLKELARKHGPLPLI